MPKNKSKTKTSQTKSSKKDYYDALRKLKKAGFYAAVYALKKAHKEKRY